MKIVQINAVYEYSSTGRTTMEMHEYLRSIGVESHVFCTNKNIPSQNVYKVGCNWDYKVHSLMSRLTDGQGLFSKRTTKKLLAHLDAIKPDVVILRNLHANYLHYPSLLTYLAEKDIATIVVLHDVWTFTGHCCYYTVDNCLKWKTNCHHCPALGNYNKSWFWDNSAANFKRKLELFRAIPRLSVIGVSKWVTEEARQSPIFANAQCIDYIYNWIDLKKFFPQCNNDIRKRLDLEGQFTVVSVAQGWCEGKGLFIIFEVARRLPDIHFVLVGSMAYGGQMPDNVISVGVTSNVSELAQYYSMADALLVCSVQETFGKVSAEALACGTPVLANNATANPEIAGDECGLKFENNDVEEIVAAIEKMKRMGKQCYMQKCVQRAAEEFNFETQIQKYLNLFKEMISWKK